MDHSTGPTSTLSTPCLPIPPDTESLVSAVVFSLCFLVGVPGNIAVIILRPNWEHLSSLSQSLLLNLAMSDLLCLLTLPVWIHAYLYGWKFGPVSCKLLAYTVYCSIYCNLLTVTGLSIQRYLLVVHWQSGQQVQKRLLLILLWLVALILSIPALVVRQVKTDQQWPECQSQYFSDTQQIVVLMAEVVFGFASFTTVTVLYIRLHKKINQAAFFNHPQTTRLVTSIITSLFFLWIPYITINLLDVAAISLKNEKLLKSYKYSWNIVKALPLINSCLNPLLYAFTSRRFCTMCQKKEPVQQSQRFSQATNIATITE